MATTNVSSSASPSSSIQIITDGASPPAEIHIIYHSDADESGATPNDVSDTEMGTGTESEVDSLYDNQRSQKTLIDNITITTKGPKPPAEIKVTVTCDIANTGGQTPKVFFPSQSMGLPMTHSGGDTWTVSNTQMYGRGEKLLTIKCNGVTVVKKFKAG